MAYIVGNNEDLYVVAPQLDDPADIQVAFSLFYEGNTSASGVETHLKALKNRVLSLELGSQIGQFPAGTFKIYKTTVGTDPYVQFNLNQITANTTLSVDPASSGSLVTTGGSQSLTSKTLDSSNLLKMTQASFRIQNSDTNYINFNVTPITGIQTITVRDWGASSPLEDYLVVENFAQTLKSKTFTGYKETVLSLNIASAGATATVDSDQGNVAYIDCSASGYIDISNLSNGKSVLLVCKATNAATPTIRYISGGSPVTTIKWAGASAPGAITAGTYALIAVSMIGPSSEVFGSYLGAYS